MKTLKRANYVGFTSVSRDHWDYQQRVQQYPHAKLKVFTKNATENAVVMIK